MVEWSNQADRRGQKGVENANSNKPIEPATPLIISHFLLFPHKLTFRFLNVRKEIKNETIDLKKTISTAPIRGIVLINIFIMAKKNIATNIKRIPRLIMKQSIHLE
jgi:hypothetical protein